MQSTSGGWCSFAPQAEDSPAPGAETGGADLLVLCAQSPGALENLGLADIVGVLLHKTRKVNFVPVAATDRLER
jgi:hypothetical protein